MAAVAYRLRRGLRRRWTSTLTITLIVATVSAVVLTVAAGAQRTATAPVRYTSKSPIAFDGLVTQHNGGLPRTADVAALPSVASADSLTFVFGGLVAHDHPADPLSPSVLSGSYRLPFPAEGGGVHQPLSPSVLSGSYRATGARLVQGRDPDPANEHEFVASRNLVQQADLAIGETFTLVTLTQEQADDQGFSAADPQGPRVEVTLVGVIDGPAQLDDPTPIALVSPALLGEPDLGVALTMMAVDLRPSASLEDLRTQLDTLPDSEGLTLEPGKLISDPVRRAVQVQARGLWLLAAAAAVAAIAVLGQLISRHVRPSRSARLRLSAIGFTDAQILAEAVSAAMTPITFGTLLGAGLAIIPSGKFPSGFVRAIEPEPGVAAQWDVLSGGAALLVVGLGLWTVASLTLTGRTARTAAPSPTVETVATHAGSASAGMGVRLAFTRRARQSGSARGSVVGVMLAIAALVGAVTFGDSLDRLVNQPFRYGSNYDIAFGDNGAESLPDGLRERLDASPDVTALTLYASSLARIGDTSVPVLGMDVIRGDGTPTMLEGRLPASGDEIVLGRSTARDVDAHIGDQFTLAGPTQSSVFTVTGLAAVPGLGASDGLGAGGILTSGGLARIDDSAQPTNAAVKLGTGLAQFAPSVIEFVGSPPLQPYVPSAIRNVARVRAVPFALAGVLAALALLTVVHVMLTSTRGCVRELAILRSLGADRGWIRRAVLWQATSFTVLAVVLGTPIGIVAGRLVFVAFAANMGALDDASIPLWDIAIGVLAVVALANVAAAIPARRVTHIEPALLLQTE